MRNFRTQLQIGSKGRDTAEHGRLIRSERSRRRGARAAFKKEAQRLIRAISDEDALEDALEQAARRVAAEYDVRPVEVLP